MLLCLDVRSCALRNTNCKRLFSPMYDPTQPRILHTISHKQQPVKPRIYNPPPEARIRATLTHNGGVCMIAYNKQWTWTSSLQPVPLPQTFPRHLACAIEGTINTGNKCLLISCYLPRDNPDHAEACIALRTLPSEYPHPLIILGGGFQGDWTSKSDKSCNLRTLSYYRLQGSQLPTYTPTQQPEHATCIDHLLMHDPMYTTTQTRDTENISHAFLNHNGAKTTLHISLTRDYSPNAKPITSSTDETRPIRFLFSIPRPLLIQWKEEVRRTTEHPASVVHADLTYLLSTLNTPPDTITPSTRTTSDHTKTQILENANTIQDLLEEGLRIATNLFPTKAPFFQFTRKIIASSGKKQSRGTFLRSTTEIYSSNALPDSISQTP